MHIWGRNNYPKLILKILISSLMWNMFYSKNYIKVFHYFKNINGIFINSLGQYLDNISFNTANCKKADSTDFLFAYQ